MAGPKIAFVVRTLRFTAVIYYIISITFRLCFQMPGFDMFESAHVPFFDYLVDVFFLWDFIRRFRSNVVVPSDALATSIVNNNRTVRSAPSGYRQTIMIANAVQGIAVSKVSAWSIVKANIWELANILSFFPFELIAYGVGVRWYYALRALRLIRIKDLFVYWNDLSEIMHHFNIASTNYAIKRVWLLVVVLGLLGHVGACFFYAISLHTLQGGSTHAWIYKDGLAYYDEVNKRVEFTKSLSYRYLKSMYWSVQTLDTVGFGDIFARSESETWFCILFFYASAFLIYYSIANLMEVVTNYDSARTAALLKQSRFDQYATYRKLPEELAERVRAYYAHQWKLLKGVDEREIHTQLPANIAQQVKQVVVRDLLVQVESLADLNKGLLNSLTDSMGSLVYNPEDIIVDRDSKVSGLYIISTGVVKVRTVNGSKLELLPKQNFGLGGLVKPFTSTSSYIAKNYVEVLYLKGSVFRHISKGYMTKPEFDKFVRDKLKTFYELEKNSSARTSIIDSHAMSTRKSSAHLHQVVHKIKKVIFPDSEARLVWDGIIFFCLVYYFTSVALLLALCLRDNFFEHAMVLLIVGFFVDGVLLVDTWLRSKYFGYHEEGIIEIRPAQITKHFWSVHPRLVVLLELLPLDAIIGFGVNQKLYAMFRLLKLLHMRKLAHAGARFFQLITHYTGAAVSFEMSRFLALYFVLFEICHWAGCIWSLTADIGSKVLAYDITWLIKDRHNAAMDVNYASMKGVEYARSVYWAISVMSSIGYPDILATNAVEFAVIICVMFVGYLVFNTCLGAIATLMSSFNREKREFDQKVDRIKQVLQFNRIPSHIANPVVHYFDHLWTRYNGINEDEVLNSLPLTLKGAVVQHVVGPLVTSIPFFNHCSEPMENMLLAMFETRSFLDGDALMIAGELGKEMFIIEKGSVQVTAKDRSVVFATLGPGSYVGEGCLLEISARTASVYAVGYVDTYVISNDTFLKAAEKFPDEYDQIVKEIALIIEGKKKKNEELKRQHDLVSSARAAELVVPQQSKNDLVTLPIRHNDDCDETPNRGPAKANSLMSTALKSQSSTVLSPLFIDRWLVGLKVLHPDSPYPMSFDVAMFIVCLYYAIVIPLRLCISVPSSLFWVDYVLDALNWVDCFMCALVFGKYMAGELVMNRSKLWAIYKTDYLLLDVVIGLPYDLLGLLSYSAPGSDDGFLIRSVLRLPKLLKLVYAGQYFKRVERLCLDFNVNYVALRFLALTGTIVVIGHWVACGWMMLANYHVLSACTTVTGDVNCRYAGTWVEQQFLSYKLPSDGGYEWTRYIRAINWAIPTLTSEIIGDIFSFNEKESLYTFFIIFCGLSINGVIIGNIASLVSDANSETTRLHRNIDALHDYLTRRQIPADLTQGLAGFLQLLTTPEGVLLMSRDRVFAELPHSMRTAIDEQTKTLPYLRQCPFFDFCSDELLRGISSKLKTQIYIRNDKIINHGDLGHEMFFLEKGSVDVVSGDGHTLFATLEEGGFFGETAVFFKCTRAATVKCASPYCICLVLTKADLNYELRTLEYNDEEILATFRTLQQMNEKRNQAVRKNLMNARDRNHKLFKLIKTKESSDNKAPSRLSYLREKLFPPSSPFRAAWEVMALIWVVYYTFSIPLYIAFFFGPDVEGYSKHIVYEVLISIFWMADVLMKLFLFSYYSDPIGKALEIDGDKIRERYMSSAKFKFDVVSSLPYDLMILVPGVTPTAVFMVRALHMFRVLQLFEYIAIIETHSKQLFQWSLGRSASLMMKAAFAYLILNHWLACGFFMVHRYAERDYDMTYVIADGLADYDPATGRHNICNTDLRYCYARSIYFVLGTITSVGYGDMSPYTNKELIYEQMVAIVGAYIAAVLMGFCGAYQSDQDSSGEHGFKRQMHQVASFVKYRKLPGDLHAYIASQFTYLFKKSKLLHSEWDELLQKLSAPSRMELALFLNDEILQSVPIFRTSCAQLQRRIAVRLKPQFIMEGGSLYRAGDIGHTVFFVFSGRVQVTLSTDRRTLDAFGLASLRLLLHKQSQHGAFYEKGDHFGECCLLSSSGLRADTATAMAGTEVFGLVKEELWEEFLYISPSIRRQFVHELFTKVGKGVHVHHDLDTAPESEYEGDARIISLYRMAFGVLEDIYEHMDDHNDGSAVAELDVEDKPAIEAQPSDAEETGAGASPRSSNAADQVRPARLTNESSPRRSGSRRLRNSLREGDGVSAVHPTGSSDNSPRTSNAPADPNNQTDVLKELIRESTTSATAQKDYQDLFRDRKEEARKRWHFSAEAIMKRRRVPPGMAGVVHAVVKMNSSRTQMSAEVDSQPAEGAEGAEQQPQPQCNADSQSSPTETGTALPTVVLSRDEAERDDSSDDESSKNNLATVVPTRIDQPVLPARGQVGMPDNGVMTHRRYSTAKVSASVVADLADRAKRTAGAHGPVVSPTENESAPVIPFRASFSEIEK